MYTNNNIEKRMYQWSLAKTITYYFKLFSATQALKVMLVLGNIDIEGNVGNTFQLTQNEAQSENGCFYDEVLLCNFHYIKMTLYCIVYTLTFYRAL